MSVQVVILCGGQGTRIREISENTIPKPLIPIGGRPVVWHIMKAYAHFGYTDFVLCLGHLGWRLKEYFLNQQAMDIDVTVTLGTPPQLEFHEAYPEQGWRVTLADTGIHTGTASRLSRVSRYLNGEHFMLTYGDGVCDIDISSLYSFHRRHGRPLTLTGVIPPGRFGELSLDGERIVEMKEKPTGSDRYINGGFMVMNRSFIETYLSDQDDTVMLERAPFECAAASGDMMMCKHHGFWQCMDTARDWEYLNDLWNSGQAPWRTW